MLFVMRNLPATLLLISIALDIAFAATTKAMTMQEFFARRGYAAVSLRRGEDNKMYVNGKINGHSVIIMIDTGFNFTAIDQTVATEINRVGKRTGELAGANSAVNADLSIVDVDKIELGDVTIQGQRATVMNLHVNRRTPTGSHLATSVVVGEHDAVLGFDSLNRTFAMLDCHDTTLYVRGEKPDSQIATNIEQSLEASGYVVLPLTFARNSIFLTAYVNGHAANCCLDTGAFNTAVDSKHARELDVAMLQKVATGYDVNGKKADVHLASIKDFRLGDCTLGKVNVAMNDFEAMNKQLTDHGLPAFQVLLGPEILDWAHAIIDFDGQRLFVLPKK